MPQQIDLDRWPRKPQYDFFSTFEEPFFGVTVEVDCTIAIQSCKEASIPFSWFYVYQALSVASGLEHWRYRIEGSAVIEYEEVHGSVVVGRPDKTFGFTYIPYSTDFEVYMEAVQAEVTRVQGSRDLMPPIVLPNVMHISSMPWLRFTSTSHARKYSHPDSCPKLTFGQARQHLDGRWTMPLSINVHHALMDGWHVSQFVDRFQLALHH